LAGASVGGYQADDFSATTLHNALGQLGRNVWLPSQWHTAPDSMGERGEHWFLGRRLMRRLFIYLPWVARVSYAAVIFLSYGEWLDSSLKYKPSAIRMAPEDVLGFGFWVSWAISLVLFSTSILLAHFSLGKKLSELG
jgi:hypothetical protein